MERRNVEQLLRETNSLTYLNALKCALAELKEEIATIEQLREHLISSVDRARKVVRRMDNQYRAVVKCAQGPSESEVNIDGELLDLMEETHGT